PAVPLTVPATKTASSAQSGAIALDYAAPTSRMSSRRDRPTNDDRLTFSLSLDNRRSEVSIICVTSAPGADRLRRRQSRRPLPAAITDGVALQQSSVLPAPAPDGFPGGQGGQHESHDAPQADLRTPGIAHRRAAAHGARGDQHQDRVRDRLPRGLQRSA